MVDNNMSFRFTTVLALLITGLFPAMAIYSWQNRSLEDSSEQGAVKVAIHFLQNNPTFRYDGIPLSVTEKNIFQVRVFPPTWIVTLEFKNRHTGYGDRSGMVMGQAITPHEIEIVVQEGMVISAVIDDKWDELSQREQVRSELMLSEFARDEAIQYIINNYSDIIPRIRASIPDSWEYKDITPPGLVGTHKDQYTGDGWTVNVSHPIVEKPLYTVELTHEGWIYFIWKGTVDQDGTVEELEFAAEV